MIQWYVVIVLRSSLQASIIITFDELYECIATFVDVHHTEEGEEHIHSTAAGGPVHPGKSEDVCQHTCMCGHTVVLYTATFQLQFVYLRKAHIIKLFHDQDAQEIKVLHIALANLVAHYKEHASWGTPPTVPFTWYWEILARTCQLVKPDKGSFDLSWCRDGQMAVSLMAQVYSTFSEAFSVTFLQRVPDAVKQCRNAHMRRYFEWVQGIQEFICAWQQKIMDEDWTEEEILDYAKMSIPLHKIAVSLHIEALEVCMEDITRLKTDMQKLKSLVKDTLIWIDSKGRR